jgi:hypothetical protein
MCAQLLLAEGVEAYCAVYTCIADFAVLTTPVITAVCKYTYHMNRVSRIRMNYDCYTSKRADL